MCDCSYRRHYCRFIIHDCRNDAVFFLVPDARRWILHRRRSIVALINNSPPLFHFALFSFFFVYLAAINKCQRLDCRRGRPRNEMWNENVGNEWRPKLGYAKLRLKLKEHDRESIIFRESWPGERFQSLVLPTKKCDKEMRKLLKQKISLSLIFLSSKIFNLLKVLPFIS